jgi:hypothetical protein
MKEIQLTQGKVALVDDDEYHNLAQWKWHYSGCGYAMRRSYEDASKPYGVMLYMHREINRTGKGKYTDHINGDKLDNRVDNLRTVTNSQNGFNRGGNKIATSMYKGVDWSKQKRKWRARIKAGATHLNLGLFDSERDAAETYDVAAYHLHGEFAVFNLGGK